MSGEGKGREEKEHERIWDCCLGRLKHIREDRWASGRAGSAYSEPASLFRHLFIYLYIHTYTHIHINTWRVRDKVWFLFCCCSAYCWRLPCFCRPVDVEALGFGLLFTAVDEEVAGAAGAAVEPTDEEEAGVRVELLPLGGSVMAKPPPPVGCASKSSSTRREKWSEGTWMCGHPSIFCCANHASSIWSRLPSRRKWPLVKKM